METFDELYFETREEFRDWLMRNGSTSQGIWLSIFKKGSGKVSVSYQEAVEEALCFGWIDAKMRSVNREYYILRFTPRKKGSRWSKYNVERVQRLIGEGKMQAAGLVAFRETLEKPHLVYDKTGTDDQALPEDLMEAFKSNEQAYRNFCRFSPSSRRIYIEWMKSARKPETRERRILKIISQSERNLRPGMA